jgi:intracellular septation protein A
MANPPSTPEFDWKMYRYVPSLPLATLSLALFSILTLLHTYQYLRHRKSTIIYVIIGALCTYSAHHSLTNLNPVSLSLPYHI